MPITIVPHCTCDRCGAQADADEMSVVDPNILVPLAVGWGRMSVQIETTLPSAVVVLCPDCSTAVEALVRTPPPSTKPVPKD